VVPLVLGESRDVTLEKLSHLNGVLFPGGDGDYLEYGRFIYDQILEYNKNGVYYPMWGTCLGFEDLIIYASDEGTAILDIFPVQNTSLPLKFT